ncbi:TonB-dependent receptor [Patiriisocius hiemis]|uniref:TonB-dependent receptor n=1 Tax=Patiriisocius hiemis TaxID=3075604 RepID=A0ABU2Y9Q5_9FLAO|nr:TonB-dependent receptor [Constantimarinum sp. W242]MDT0554916.1 TonB-dependent receptor [Constantimarinum sp. W242]
MRIIALVLLCLYSNLTLYSQDCNYTLEGKIIDLHDGTALSGATIIVVGPETAYLSDLDGKFIVNGLCNQEYKLQISHPECNTKVFTVSMNTEIVTKAFRIEHHLEELNQITISGNAYATKSETLLENTISQEIVESYSNGSLGDVLNTLSGVSSLNTGNTVVKPVINGLHSSRVTIINNGVRMQDQEWGAEHAPNIDLNTASNITVLKGASALQYSGDAVGGVVVSEPLRVALKDSLFGKTILTAASNGRGGSITSTLTKSYENGWFASLQGTLKRFGDFEAPDYVLSNTGFFERDASIRVGLNRISYGVEGYYSIFKNKIGILRASHLGGAEDQVVAINSERPLIIRDFTYDIDVPRQEVTHHLAKISAFKKFDNLGKVSFQYNFQKNNRFEFDIRRGDDADKASVDLELTTHDIALDLLSDLSENTTLKTGITGVYQSNFADPTTGVRRLIPDYDMYKFGGYGVVDFTLSENLLLEGGLRFDYTYMDVFKFYRTSLWEERGYDELFPELVIEDLGDQLLTNPELTFNNFSGTVGATYRFNDIYNLFFNYALASRAPNASELFSEGLHHSASRIELGDLRFNSEVSQKISLTLQRNASNYSFTVNPYINFIEDFIVIEPTSVQQTIRGNFQVWEYRQTQASLVGVDINFETPLTSQLDFDTQFDIVKGRDKTRDLPLINMPAATLKNRLQYNMPKIKNLQLSLQSEYVFRQNEFPDTNFEVFIPQTETFEVVDVSTPPDAYHLLHFGANMDFKVNSKSNLNFGLRITNLLDTSYRNYLNRLRYYADDLGRNIQLNIKINY